MKKNKEMSHNTINSNQQDSINCTAHHQSQKISSGAFLLNDIVVNHKLDHVGLFVKRENGVQVICLEVEKDGWITLNTFLNCYKNPLYSVQDYFKVLKDNQILTRTGNPCSLFLRLHAMKNKTVYGSKSGGTYN
jgi:hypothetical protein